MRKESTTIQKCNSRLTALGLNSDAAFHRSKLILKIYRDVVWVLSERAEELQETAWITGRHRRFPRSHTDTPEPLCSGCPDG